MLMKMQVQVEKLREWWCRLQHQSVRWPIRGEYECATCYRRYPVPWQQTPSSRFQSAYRHHHSITVWARERHDSGGTSSVF